MTTMETDRSGEPPLGTESSLREPNMAAYETTQRLPYTTTLSDELLNVETVIDFDCEIEVSSERDCGAIVFSVDAVWLEGKNLFMGSSFSKKLAAEIASNAEHQLNTDSRLRERAMGKVAA